MRALPRVLKNVIEKRRETSRNGGVPFFFSLAGTDAANSVGSRHLSRVRASPLSVVVAFFGRPASGAFSAETSVRSRPKALVSRRQRVAAAAPSVSFFVSAGREAHGRRDNEHRSDPIRRTDGRVPAGISIRPVCGRTAAPPRTDIRIFGEASRCSRRRCYRKNGNAFSGSPRKKTSGGGQNCGLVERVGRCAREPTTALGIHPSMPRCFFFDRGFELSAASPSAMPLNFLSTLSAGGVH
mmetsp:Transcript_10216/g.24820  ORF Transcript_10216/g.24820 Transcript_10216/m.24820 type:complete len:240 (+) Transcript_10216:178-897(+)